MDTEQELSGESREERMERYAGVEDDADEDEDEMEEIDEDYGRRVLAHILAQYHAQLAALSTISFEVFQEFLLATERAKPIPYHTLILSGEGWVKELRNGHPERIRTELAVHKHVFTKLLEELQEHGHTHSKHVTLEEQLAIFLYACVTGLSIRHLGERFQRSNSTISKYAFHLILCVTDSSLSRYFKKMLVIFSSPGIYTRYVRLPHANDPVHPSIQDNPKYYPFFKDAVGAIDGTHIACTPAAAERDAARNRKGFTSQNCLVCCDFNMNFTYVLSGWEGSMADASVYHDARTTDFTIPDGKYYLADAGYPNCRQLLIPYRGQRYHLAEWGRAQVR